MVPEQFGVIANLEPDSEATYHIADERGSNYPFHPVARCGQVLNRELVADVPQGAAVCKSCSGEKAEAKKGEVSGNGS